jgi:predicted nucleotide-binding protein
VNAQPAIAQDLTTLRDVLIARAVSKYASENTYRGVRGRLLSERSLKGKLPSFVLESPNLKKFWRFISTAFHTYSERREFVDNSFAPLLLKLAQGAPPQGGRHTYGGQAQQRAGAGVGLQEGRREVFVVHGHDAAVKESVARFIERLKLKPIILHEYADQGRTIIEKFEECSSAVGFAVVLLTPDDTGRAVGSAELKPRARQNVILELGYFIGVLGRRHVCALKAPSVEVPSDLDGLLYVELDAAGAWRLRLAKEMKAAGLDVDLNLVSH